MNILAEIVDYKRYEVEKRKELYPTKLLEQSKFLRGPTVSLRRYLERQDLSGIIAEIKRASPSVGILNNTISVEKLSIGYMQAGASALSVLTDEKYFKGTLEDLQTARRFNFCPVLRKDFIIDEYQILEARAHGADAILLIAACISPAEILRLSAFAKSLGLEVLLEIHDASELTTHLVDTVDCVGVNNRNLKTMEVSIEQSLSIIAKIPGEFIPVTESGISTPEQYQLLKNAGYRGFLMGTCFMKTSDPARTLGTFIQKIKEL